MSLTHTRLSVICGHLDGLLRDIASLSHEQTLPDASKTARKLDAARCRAAEMRLHMETAAGVAQRVNPALAEIHSLIAVTIRDVQRAVAADVPAVDRLEDIESAHLDHEARLHAVHVAQTRAAEMLLHLTHALAGLKASADGAGYGGSA